MLEKIAKRLKRFTLAEIKIYTDFDCKNELDLMVKNGVLHFYDNVYVWIEPKISDFKIIGFSGDDSNFTVEQAVQAFINDHVKQNSSEWSQKTYISIFKTNILPFFKDRILAKITLNDVANFNKFLESKGLSDYRIKNSLMLLNQLLHYFQEKGVIPRTCDFKVKRLKKTKNEKVILNGTEVENILKLAKSKDRILYQLLLDIAKGEEKFSAVISKNDIYFRKGRSKKMEEKTIESKV